MKEFKMRFKDFVFDTNPSYIQVITSRDVSNTSVYEGKGITQDISQKPIIVKGKGAFFSDDADEKCAHLSYLLRQGGAGELHCPSLYPIEAIFTGLSMIQVQRLVKSSMNLSLLRCVMIKRKLLLSIILLHTMGILLLILRQGQI